MPKKVETTIARSASIRRGLVSTMMMTGTTEVAIDWNQAMTNHSESVRATRECDRLLGLQQQQKKQQQQTEQQ